MFSNSIRLFGSNWSKSLKFFLFYVVVWAISVALFLPVFFQFKVIIVPFLNEATSIVFVGIFKGSIGQNLLALSLSFFTLIGQMFAQNLGLSIYAMILVFFILPLLINIAKYSLYQMLYSYMTSNAEVGFFSALIKSLKKSLPYAVCKTIFNLVLFAVLLGATYGFAHIENPIFKTYCYAIVMFILLVLLFTLYQICVLGWAPSMVVFDCNVFVGFKKGFKAVKRHFCKIFMTTLLYFTLFWAIIMLIGVYTMLVLIPFATALLCMYDMVVFFTSQGMRFYINKTKIMTPKKLEEVDNINKTAAIL